MTLKNQSYELLKFKESLLLSIIEEYADDPRVDEPERQLRIIQEELESRDLPDENEKLPDENKKSGLVVGLKTLELRGSSSLKR